MSSFEDCLAVQLRVMDIIAGTTVDGPGFRTSIYFAGCDHHCPGCHNPATWDHDSGRIMTVEAILEEIKRADFNVTFSGGDPMYQAQEIAVLAEQIKQLGYDIWCYTGFTFDVIQTNPVMSNLLKYVDVLVDGPFIETLRDTSLIFRGSSNQRLIDVRSSSLTDVRLWESDF